MSELLTVDPTRKGDVVDSITELWTIILYYVTIYSASVLRAHAAFHTDNVLSVFP